MASELWHKSLTPLMESVREKMGDRPVYISFDIDGIDPGFCPGTGKAITYVLFCILIMNVILTQVHLRLVD